MQKIDFKKHILKISLIFILMICAFLCIYTVSNYKSNNTNTQNNKFRGEGNSSNNDANNMQNNQKPPENIPSSDGNAQSNQNMQAHQNGGVTPQDGNRQQGQNGGMASQNGNKQSGQNGNMQRGNTNTKYVPALTAYSAIFLILCIGIYYLFRRKNIKINFADEKILIFTLLVAGFLLRIAASTLMDGHNDVNLFKNWASIAANSLSQFYSNARSADYPPLYIYVLALIGKIASTSAFSSYFTLLLKIPSIIADIVTSYFIYKLGRKHFNSVISILMAAFYIFNPAIFIDSTFWGQVDSIFTLFIVSAIFLLSEKKISFASSVFAVAVLMKPQGIIFLPILFFELVRERNLKAFIKAVVSGVITALIIILPFSLNQKSPLWIFKLYANTISEYPYASVNGFNFYSLIGANYKNNTDTLFVFNYHTWGMIFIVATTLFSWFIYIKGKNKAFTFAIALLQIAGVFTFSAGMHERYLFPAVALSILAFIYLKDRRFFILSIGFSITSYINISAVLFSLNSSNFNTLLMITSLLNVLLVGYLVKVLFDNAFKKIQTL
ncbi:glycosyltransferase family 39 protein [Clostridium uliginosum]|uniref:Mannosyltransferase related to Gpi18 n=1 Tax=Clostridium uliginosum TaxID=119641 RepID=A0A1I1JSF9_9CLOT|nr:glycosyltransferase family 39 protein [Clostridium uliginosum]SFC51504.1 Mannosyltransferase related to Gpi18 [Clostridium uliginosum]